MLYTVDINVLKREVNIHALKVLQTLSKKYPDYRFYVTGVDSFADNLPCVATIIDEEVPDETVYAIDIEYSDMLEEVLDKNGGYPRLYECMDIVPFSMFDEKWFTSGELCFYVQSGDFYKEV